jgi:hypothetical protein
MRACNRRRRDPLATRREMIVSHRHKFIFIKTHKTAGTSIEIALSRYCGDEDIVTPISPPDEAIRRRLGYPGPRNCFAPLVSYRPRDFARLIVRGKRKLRFYNHMTAAEAVGLLGPAVWDSYFKFCFERNPWDKVVSLYFHHPWIGPRPELDDFVQSGDALRVADFASYTIDGRIAVDHVARYENMTEELERIRRRLNLPAPLELPRAKGEFRTDRRPYRELYSESARDWIARHFAREIAHGGYAF